MLARTSLKTYLRRAASIPLVLAGVLASSIVAANPAAAAVPGLGLVTAVSAANPFNKTVTATCPGGRTLTGTAGAFATANGEAIMDDLLPLNPSQVRVSGVEDLNLANNWTVTAFAICANPLPWQIQIAATSPANAVNKSVTATCPAGRRLTGTGADILGGGNDVLISAITPNAALTSVTVTGNEEDATTVNWSVRAVALCAAPRPGQTLVTTTSPFSPVNKSIVANCPAGTNLTGTGGAILNGGGNVGMNRITPAAGLTGVTVDGNEVDPVAANWAVRAFGICTP